MGSSGQLAFLTSSDNRKKKHYYFYIVLLLLSGASLLTLHAYYTVYLSSCHQAEISIGMSHALNLFIPYLKKKNTDWFSHWHALFAHLEMWENQQLSWARGCGTRRHWSHYKLRLRPIWASLTKEWDHAFGFINILQLCQTIVPMKNCRRVERNEINGIQDLFLKINEDNHFRVVHESHVPHVKEFSSQGISFLF